MDLWGYYNIMNSLGVRAFFEDDKGNISILQKPNAPLYGWIVFKLLSLIIDTSNIKNGFAKLSTAFLFTWAYLEITKGKSYFRRTFGLVIMVLIIVSYFRN